MNRQNGALRIFWYNWPMYLGTWGLAVLVILVVPLAKPQLATTAAVAGSILVVWSIASLLVSFYIYDRSALLSGSWISPLLRPTVRTWATVHAGLDAEVDLDAVMPGSCVARLDVFDPTVMTSASIRRARRRTALTKPARSCRPATVSLPDQASDAIVVAFTAHEIRDPHARERFFAELRRSLRPGGQLVLVEHLRDFMNFLAFGPGCFHFLPRREWLRLASHAQLRVAHETRITPWIMALTLERAS